MSRSAAFFDLDKTLMAGSSAIHFARAAYNAGMLTRTQLVRDGWAHVRYRLEGASDEATEEVMRRVTAQVKGVHEREIKRMGPAVLAGILPRVYPEMLDEIYEHQDEGRAAVIVSAAGNELVGAIASVLGMDAGLGTRYGIDPDRAYTGELDGPFCYGEGKVVYMREYAEAEGIDLEASWAYSDSVSDLPMLSAVGNPVVVNPDSDLREIAKREGWRIMVFEKLGRRLAIAGTTLAAVAIGGSGTMLARHRSRRGGIGLRRRRR